MAMAMPSAGSGSSGRREWPGIPTSRGWWWQAASAAGCSGLLPGFPRGGVPSTAGYGSLAISPDGRTRWASPSSGHAWYCSDVLDLASRAVSRGPPWDTGVAQHPSGGLVVTLTSDVVGDNALP
jgi:hypothetical protein